MDQDALRELSAKITRHWAAVFDVAWNGLEDRADSYNFVVDEETRSAKDMLFGVGLGFEDYQRVLADKRAKAIIAFYNQHASSKVREAAADYAFREYLQENGSAQAQFFDTKDELEGYIAEVEERAFKDFSRGVAKFREILNERAFALTLPDDAPEEIVKSADAFAEFVMGIIDSLQERALSNPEQFLDEIRPASDRFKAAMDECFPL